MDDTSHRAPAAPSSAVRPAGATRGLVRLLRWLRGSLRGMTWQRYGIFCLVVFVFAVTRPSVARALADPGMADLSWAIGKALAYSLLNFTPILLAVVVAENRGPRHGGRRIAALAAAVLIGSLVGAAMWSSAALWLDAANPALAWLRLGDDPLTGLRKRGGSMLGDCVISIAAVAFWYFFKRDLDAARALQRERQDHEEAQRETAEARLQVMRAQIEPHFLFNTLASIRRLYETDAAAGRAMLQHLSRYLTASLPILRENRSTLGRELALTVAYLNVQKIRMGARLTVDVDVPSTLHAVEIPPMMLATLVENAVIHGLGPLPSGGRIRICARARSGEIVIEVEDTGRGLQDSWGAGVGLANIRARLASQYGTAAELRLVDNHPNPGVTATLVVPFEPRDTLAAAA